MTDPYRPGPSGWHGADSEPATHRYPPIDPAYAGQTPTYGYLPPYTTNPTEQIPRQPWNQGQPAEPAPTGTEPPSPEPPKSPKWLWLLAGAAVLLVVGLVIALVIANGGANKSATVSTVPAAPTTKAGTSGTRSPTTTASPTTTTAPPSTSPAETTGPEGGESVVYNVTGTGRAISITYTDADSVVQTEFNVPLPWSKDVTLASSNSANLIVTNFGDQITCSVTVNGTQVSQHTGSITTICTSTG